MKIYDNGIPRYMTAEEIALIADEQEKAKAEANLRNLTQSEVIDLLIRAQVNSVSIDDQTSARMMDYYPEFYDLIGQTLDVGFKLRNDGRLYKTAQTVTVSGVYLPGAAGTESLYTRIDLVHLGNKYDPIPYEGNQELEAGKFYTQYGAMYLCNRNTETAVHHALSELVGLYVTLE